MTRRVLDGRVRAYSGYRVNAERVGLPTRDEREALYADFERLYDTGHSDMQIAEQTGCCDRTVRRWRHRTNRANIYGKLVSK